MGLSRASICFLIEEAQRRPFSGTLLTLSVQNVFLNQTSFEAIADRMGYRLRPLPGDLSQKPLISGTVTSEHVFRRLGFDRVVTTDVSDFEGADLIFDLNDPEIPDGHAERYDMVLDSGTLEHIFHLPNALKNMVGFTRPGGRIVHLSPSSNHIDHGFYMFSPTFFWDYYTANGFELPTFDLVRYRASGDDGSLWDYGAYEPGALDKRSFGGLGGGCFALALVAEKVSPSQGTAIPQQGMYRQAWADEAPPGIATAGAGPERPGRHLRTAIKRLKRAVAGQIPVDWRIRWKAARRRFPLRIRKRY